MLGSIGVVCERTHTHTRTHARTRTRAHKHTGCVRTNVCNHPSSICAGTAHTAPGLLPVWWLQLLSQRLVPHPTGDGAAASPRAPRTLAHACPHIVVSGKCSAVQCSAVRCRAVQFSHTCCSEVQCGAVQCSAVRCGAGSHSLRESCAFMVSYAFRHIGACGNAVECRAIRAVACACACARVRIEATGVENQTWFGRGTNGTVRPWGRRQAMQMG